ncbi:MAG TPA: TetR/AcrR family transcriptional regulator [Rhodocyclaceae bacterium]
MIRTERHSRRCKETRPADLVSAARVLFAEKGFAATRLEDVAAKAGVSKGTVYLYFDSKETLFRAVVESGLTALGKTVEVLNKLAAETGRPPTELLSSYFGAWRLVLDDADVGDLLKLLIAESGNFPDVVSRFNDAIMRDAKRTMVHIVEAGIASRDFRPVPASTIADLFFSAVGLWAIDHWSERPAPQRFLDGIFDILTRGLVSVRST